MTERERNHASEECRLRMRDVRKALSASQMPEFCIGSNDWRSLLGAAEYTMDP